MVSRLPVAVYFEHKENKFDLLVACIPDIAFTVRAEARKFGTVWEIEKSRGIINKDRVEKSFDFGLIVHAIYAPDEVAKHLREFGEELVP